jgi:hypothetical protein
VFANLSLESAIGLAIGLASGLLWLYGLIDAAFAQPMSVWEGAGRSRAGWILIQLLFPVLGSFVYVLGVRRELVRTRRPAVESTRPPV